MKHRPTGQFRGIFPVPLSIALRSRRFVPAKVRTLRNSQVAFARFERRTVLSLDRLYLVGAAGSRRRKRREEENAWDAERCGARREKRLRAHRRRNARRGSTHARTHVRIRTNETNREWALASLGRGLVTSACRRRPKEKQKE